LKTISAAVAAGFLTLLLGTGTAAAAAPAATTGGASNISSGGARLAASVDPNGRATTIYFEYGKNRTYGSRTADVSAGSGDKARTIRVDVGGLAPNTTYHYRVVASNADGVVSGGDKSFKTKAQPLGLQITANPNPVVFGSPVTVAGTLTGTGNANKRLQLQARGFPYTSEFGNVGNPIVTDAAGNFSIPLLPPGANTQYRVQTVDKPTVTSPVVSLGVAVRVGTGVSKKIVKRGRKVRFFGTFRPARSGSQFAIQKARRDGSWVNVAGGIARGGTADYTRFSKRVKIRRGGDYRVFISIIDGNYVSGIGRTIHITSHR
jgi:hypothetical protein